MFPVLWFGLTGGRDKKWTDSVNRRHLTYKLTSDLTQLEKIVKLVLKSPMGSVQLHLQTFTKNITMFKTTLGKDIENYELIYRPRILESSPVCRPSISLEFPHLQRARITGGCYHR